MVSQGLGRDGVSWPGEPSCPLPHKAHEGVFRPFFLIVILLLLPIVSGCLTRSVSPRVEDNVFVSESVPRIRIRVHDDMPYLRTEKSSPTVMDSFGSESTIGLVRSRYLFGSEEGEKVFVLEMVSFRGPGNNWDLLPLDYAGESGVLVPRKMTMGEKPYNTGVFIITGNDRKYLSKSYTRMAGINVRLTITYVELISGAFTEPAPLSPAENTLVESFSIRADRSFTVLP